MKEGHDGSGLGLTLRDLGGEFEELKGYPILSGICSKKGVQILNEFMHKAGFTLKDIWTPKIKFKKKRGAVLTANLLKLLVPEVGIEPTWALGPRDFETVQPKLCPSLKLNKSYQLQRLMSSLKLTESWLLLGFCDVIFLQWAQFRHSF